MKKYKSIGIILFQNHSNSIDIYSCEYNRSGHQKLGRERRFTAMALSSLIKLATQEVKPQVTTIAKVDADKVEESVDIIKVISSRNVETKKEVKPVVKVPTIKKELSKNLFMEDFGRDLKRAELWFGNPATGKTFAARRIADAFKEKGFIEDYVVVNCHEEMTVMSILKTTKTDEAGNWKFLLNRTFNVITDNLQKPYIVIFDEFNLLSMSVMKALQPILDDTEGSFEFEDKRYQKNPNVFFIMTMNHKDIGTSTIPDAVLDRTFPKFFKDLTTDLLAERSGVPQKFIELMEKIHRMFAHLGNLPEFHKSVRKLKNIIGLNKEQFKDYIISELELANIEWADVVRISPEFENFIDEFEKIKF